MCQRLPALFSNFIQSSPEGTFLLHIFETERCKLICLGGGGSQCRNIFFNRGAGGVLCLYPKLPPRFFCAIFSYKITFKEKSLFFVPFLKQNYRNFSPHFYCHFITNPPYGEIFTIHFTGHYFTKAH